ncbi:MAG TPA: peptidyl-prolyl cis-trans isomerase [Myxococcota bacterium]|nr:peptidyl-prolyl cis-trans isomerase [Myxococcota bacterium]
MKMGVAGRLAPFVLLAGLCACGSHSGDDGWAAEVDGQKIPAADLRREVDQRVEDNPAAKREDVAREVLQRLVSDQVVLNYARKRQIDVTPAEVEARLRQIHGDDWKDPDPRYRDSVRREMILERTALADLGERARVPDSALKAYYDEHKAEYAAPARVQIRQIVVAERPKAEALRTQLEGGADFAELARANSIGPEAKAGGELKPFAKGELPEAFDRAFDTEPGQISPVIESPYGFHLFQVEARLPPHETSFEEVREKIALDLNERALDDLRRDWVRELRKKAEIHVNDRVMETMR